MIIRALRLKNIKSYGEGVDGNGITIHFESGINRIAGRNGHGKTTLIESLGYALFLARPLFEENFTIESYLLRAGKKAGEIDVTFDHGGASYRLERGLGSASQRRAKVVLLSDGSLCAEGEAEVTAFLCRLLGLDGADRLTELFAKLIGVKQGRLTWPFDSKASEARKHFEPLLEVEIFRQCFDRLKPVVDRFENLAQEQTTSLAAVTARLHDRRDSPDLLRKSEAQVGEIEGKLAAATAELKTAEATRQQFEAREKALQDAQRTAEAAQHALAVAAEKRQGADTRMKEARDAAGIVALTTEAHTACLAAEKQIAALNARQGERMRAEKKRGEAVAQHAKLQEQAESARQQAATFLAQQQEKTQALEEHRHGIETATRLLADTKAAFEQRTATAATQREHEAKIRSWIEQIERRLRANDERAAELTASVKKLEAWDAEAAAATRDHEKLAAEKSEDLTTKLAAARQEHQTFEIQLSKISGGTCPFLKEQCHQFDPGKVRSDLQTTTTTITQLEKDANSAREAHIAARAVAEKIAREEAQLASLRETITRRFDEFCGEYRDLISADVSRAIEQLGGPRPSFQQVPTTNWASELKALCADAAEQLRTVQNWFDQSISEFARRATEHDTERQNRVKHEQEARHRITESEKLALEINKLATSAASRTVEAERLSRDAEQSAQTIKEFALILQTFATLDEDLAAQQKLKADHTDGYRRYLGAKPAADQLTERERTQQAAANAEQEATATLHTRRDALQAAQRDFDAPALEAARHAYQQKHNEVAALNVHLSNARADLAREQKRHAEYLSAQNEQQQIEGELGRLQAALELTKKARHVLPKAAPHVAQHLCGRIAARAQQIFHQINPDPIELEWDAHAYSLRIGPGDRRFAMLSGGEQTKLALAMTLAMIQQFSGLKFCIFDEPTYGVDADSRAKLADAIVEAQRAAGLEQLLLVSHDDAFDGKIEHVVLLSKAAGSGTRIAEAGAD